MLRPKLMAELPVKLVTLVRVVWMQVIVPFQAVNVPKANECLLQRQVKMSTRADFDAEGFLLLLVGSSRIIVVKAANTRGDGPHAPIQLARNLRIVRLQRYCAQ